MFQYFSIATAVVLVFLTSAVASAQTAFVEGHVFNSRSGAPLPGATVVVVENITVGPLPIELASGVTDSNGFYQFQIDDFLGAPATIEVMCGTAKRRVRGGSSAVLRDGVIRRDIYLNVRRHLRRCRPIESQ
jgi:hypothetical protein